MKISRSLVVAGVVIVLLAGCATDAPAPIADPPVESSTPTPTRTPSVEPVLGDLVITPEGIGALVLGAPVSSDAASIAEYDPAYCGDGGDDYAGAWKSTDSAEPFLIDSTDDDTKGGNLTAIAVYTAGVTTDQGIAVGATEDEFVAAHPEAVKSNGPFEIYSIPGEAGTLYAEFETGKLVAMVAESLDKGPLEGALYATDAYHPCA